MEMLVLALIGGAFALGFHLGRESGYTDGLKLQKSTIDRTFFHTPDDPFRSAFGVKGIFIGELNSELEGTALVVIQSADFLDFVAQGRDPERADTRKSKRIREQLLDEYLLKKGMDPSRLAALKMLSKELQ